MTVVGDVLVAGIGNIFLGDDGFGSEVARRLTADDGDRVRVVDYGIRGMHLAYDLVDGVDTLILIDAVPGPGAPGTVSVRLIDEVPAAPAVDAHAMTPSAVLASLRALGGRLPTTYLIGCVPEDVSEGIGLSATVEAAVEPAAAAVRELLSACSTRAEVT
ncbi:hydrogenase maturation protease [Tsukamurella soli]|uniref:Hydrogenase maturation protease n=1 Tax=Tsukamurella soli TaxID=644556 RepID=A0ABP8JF44_9ACTN